MTAHMKATSRIWSRLTGLANLPLMLVAVANTAMAVALKPHGIDPTPITAGTQPGRGTRCCRDAPSEPGAHPLVDLRADPLDQANR